MRGYHVRVSELVVPAAVMLLLTTAAAVHASPVAITGGFTSFTGLAAGTDGSTPANISPGCSDAFTSFVGGQVLQAASCPPGPGGAPGFSGAASLAFSSTLSSVEFYERQFFGDDPHNNVTFTPATTQQVASTANSFLLGELSFRNGTWFGAGKVNRFHIELTTNSPDAAFNAKTLSDDLVLDIRVGSTAEDNGDCFSFAGFVPLGQVCAYEPGVPGKPNTTTVQLYGKIGSLIPTQFANVTGGFLLDSSGNVVPADPSPTAAPEPMSLLLLGTGLAATVRRWRRVR